MKNKINMKTKHEIKEEIMLYNSIYDAVKSKNFLRLNNLKFPEQSVDVEFHHHIYKSTQIAIDNDTQEFYILNESEMIDFVQKKMEIINKKQPIIAGVCIDIFKHSVRRYGDIYALKEGLNAFSIVERKLLDRDVIRNLKNGDYNFEIIAAALKDYKSNEYPPELIKVGDKKYQLPVNFEELDDNINDVIISQKAKKMIQKIYSSKYKDLINSETIDKFKVLVQKNVSISDVNSSFGRKLARHHNVSSANKALNNYLNELSGWNIENYIKKANDCGATISKIDQEKLCIKIHTYDQSKELGSGQWCLSYDKGFFKQYKGKNNAVIFTYDFEKEQSDQTSMCGLIVSEHGDVTDGHWRDDMSIPKYYEEEDEDEPDVRSLVDFYDMMPSNTSNEEHIENIWDSAMLQGDDEKITEFMLKYCIDIKYIDVLERALWENVLAKNVNSGVTSKIEDYYTESKVEEGMDAKDIIEKKRMRSFVENYISYINKVKGTDDSLEHAFIKNEDFDLLEKYLGKQSLSYSTSLLANPYNNLEKKNTKECLLRIFKRKKETEDIDVFNSLKLGSILMKNELKTPSDLSDFNKEIIEINNGRVDIGELLNCIVNNNNQSRLEIAAHSILDQVLEYVDNQHFMIEWALISDDYNGDDLGKDLLQKIKKKASNLTFKKSSNKLIK